MHYNFKNQQLINNLYLHDFVFTGFSYDYYAKEVMFSCRKIKKAYNFIFHNVLEINMQSGFFWGEINRIYDIVLGDCTDEIKKLTEIHSSQGMGTKTTSINLNHSYISVEFPILSGDVLKIICESMDCLEVDIK